MLCFNCVQPLGYTPLQKCLTLAHCDHKVRSSSKEAESCLFSSCLAHSPSQMLCVTDRPKLLNLHLLNSGTKDVPITVCIFVSLTKSSNCHLNPCVTLTFIYDSQSVRTTPSNEAVTVDFKAVTLKAGENRYTKVASISFDGKLLFYVVLMDT